DHIDILRGGDHPARRGKDHQRDETEAKTAIAVEDTADKELTDPIRDQKYRDSELDLQAAHVHGRGHAGQGRKIDIGRKTGERKDGQRQQGGDWLIALLDHAAKLPPGRGRSLKVSKPILIKFKQWAIRPLQRPPWWARRLPPTARGPRAASAPCAS